MFRTPVPLLSFLTILAVAAPTAGAALPQAPPALQLESTEDGTRIWVEVETPGGGRERHLLRETLAPVSRGKSGGDGSGLALFATWDEGEQRWFSYSRDGGGTWAASRELRTEIRLLDSPVPPGTALPPVPAGYELPAGGRLFLVQFRTIVLPEWRAALERLGVEVLGHFPHNGSLVRADRGLLEAAESLDFVERVEPYHPWYRLEPALRGWLDGSGDPAEASGSVLRVRVQVFEWGPGGKQRVIETAESLGASVASYWPSGRILELWVDRDQLRALAAHDEVQWIDRWTPPGEDMDLVREDAGTNWVESRFGYCGQGVRGEVMDSGIQSTHPDFDGIILHGPTGVASHGTSTYGIVFGNGDRDGDGSAQGTGHMPCPQAQGIFADHGSVTDRFAHTQELKQDPYFASFQSNSWGANQTIYYTTDSEEMDDIIFRLDIAITQSQSNTGNQSSRPQAWAKNVISVGGIRHYDTLDTSDDAWAGGASIGPADDGRIKPDLNYWYDDIFTTTTGSGYTTSFGGTSAATPEVAGVLGLMVQMWADNVWLTDPEGETVFEKQPHASTIKALLVNNARQYEFTGASHDLTRTHQGWGRPSARVAYERAPRSFIVDEAEPLTLGQTATYQIDVPPGESELKVTMVYPDPPGKTSASLHRINDVDLRVTSPSATLYHGNNGLDVGTESVAGGGPDGLNTVENVFLRDPQAGLWTVEVEAVEVNEDGHLGTPEEDVVFALVVTGARGVYSSGEGRVHLGADGVSCDQSLSVTVRDGNAGGGSVTVALSSETETVPETVVLQETNPGSGNYVGSFSTTGAGPLPGDGLLSVTHGDTVLVEYLDADDGQGGMNLPRQDTASVDCLGPVISQVGETDVTDTAATITWTTDEASTSRVEWGEGTPPDQTTDASGTGTEHRVRLTGLQECTIYHYAVSSADTGGNLSEDDNGGSYYHFETLFDFGQGLESCHQGRVRFELDAVSCSSSLPVRVTDIDLNADPGSMETVTVHLSSTTEPGTESLLLVETGANTAIFTGSLPTAPGEAVADDGILQTSDGDLVSVRYEDADDGTGSPATSIHTIPADCSGPEFKIVSASALTAESATISWTTSEETTGQVEWGLSPALGNVETSVSPALGHAVSIGLFGECDRVYFRIVATDASGNSSVADVEGSPYELNASTFNAVTFRDGFESDQGWSLEGEWEIDGPQGLGRSPGDPEVAIIGQQVLGHDLSGLGANPGDYEPSTTESAVSPVIDASGLSNGELRLYRWYNADSGGIGYLEVTDGGGVWQEVWASPTFGGHTDSSWQSLTYDVSAWSDGNASFQIRFRQRVLNPSAHAAGWNVDRLILRDAGAPLYAACGGCGGAPSFAGVLSAVDDDPCADSGLTLSWAGAAAWGTGNGGTYAIYRDTAAGFTPGPGNLVASGVSGTSWTDPSPPSGVTLYYLVRAENDETCSTGPANGGVTEGNTVYASGINETSQPAPGTVGHSLLVEEVNRAHVLLRWTASPSAASYRVYRSAVADTGFGLQADTPETRYEDPDAYADSASWYYLVQAADACGNEESD
jgi:hypothetical protein